MVANTNERAFDRASPLNRDLAPGAEVSRLGDLLPQILARYGCADRAGDGAADRGGAEGRVDSRGAETIRFHRGPAREPKSRSEMNRPDIARGRRRVG